MYHIGTHKDVVLATTYANDKLSADLSCHKANFCVRNQLGQFTNSKKTFNNPNRTTLHHKSSQTTESNSRSVILLTNIM